MDGPENVGHARWVGGALLSLLVTMSLAQGRTALAQDADLAQELTNPVPDPITLPVQINFDDNIGPDDRGSRVTTNIRKRSAIDALFRLDASLASAFLDSTGVARGRREQNGERRTAVTSRRRLLRVRA